MTNFLARAPFNLEAEDLQWVTATFDRLSLEEKVGQLFNLALHGPADGLRDRIARLKPGGISRFFMSDMDAEIDLLDGLQSDADVPLLVSADFEGSRMSLEFGASVPNPLALAAIDDLAASREIAEIMAREAVAIGINWSFTPVVDINAAFRSAIVATRGFGSDPETIRRHALAQIEVFQKHGIAATVKHWPGEGYDDRDQHLVTTINPLSLDEWEASFGMLYRSAIDAGVLSVMSAHIALPEFVRMFEPDAGLEAYRPASISELINIDLLRGRLGFNGLIVSDATSMAGLGSWGPYPQTRVEVIANGCDMILFTDTPERDMAEVLAAVQDGRIPQARFEDAVLRVLGLKAALGLHRRIPVERSERVATLQSEDSRIRARAITGRAPTLVKDVQGLMPIHPERHKRVLVVSGGIVSPFHSDPLPFSLPDRLRDEGFAVTLFEPGMSVTPDDFDLMIYLLGDETLLTRGRIFMDWAKLSGNFIAAMGRHWHEIPTVLLAFGYPYYLYDAPRMPALVNAYNSTDAMQDAVVDCMLGRAPWNPNSPVDPFCGLEDARY